MKFYFEVMKQQEPGYSEKIKAAETLSEEYIAGISEVERKVRGAEIRQELHEISVSLREKMGIEVPGVLLCLLDIYEITRDEAMLQEVLDVVSGNLEQLEVSADSVKLLSYCYYYVEEEECAERAGKMLRELLEKAGEQPSSELTGALEVFREMTGDTAF